MENYIDFKKKLYYAILEFLEEPDDEISQQLFEKLCANIKNYHIESQREEMMQFPLTIKSIADNHHRESNFIPRISKIIDHYKEQIKQTLSNNEIFHMFENNKLIVHFLLKNGIINISEEIYYYMINKIEPSGNRYCHFFYPELEKLKGEEKMKAIKEELLSLNPNIFENFEEKRQEGENDSEICSLIRKDSIEEFIIYINRKSISISSEITPSIFETNSFLIDNKIITLIEYSAFFGSIQIFKYLRINNAEIKPSLWLYSIHSKNAELINLHESNEYNDYLPWLIESIKCHHNDFANYIQNILMDQQEVVLDQAKVEILSNSMKYNNYSYFQTDLIKEQGFFYLCFYNFYKIVDFLLEEKEDEIKKKII